MNPEKQLAELKELHAQMQAQKMADHQRALPFGDLVQDRWERAKALRFGENTSIYDSSNWVLSKNLNLVF